jgi:hypothetical protein
MDYQDRCGQGTSIRRFAAPAPQILVQRLACHLRQFEPNGMAGLPLANIGPVVGVAVGRDVIDAQSDEITMAELAFDSQIEHRQVKGALLQLQLRAYRPIVAWP